MNQVTARKITKSMIKIGHPLFDVRTKEAQEKTVWIFNILKPYIKKDCSLIDLGCGTGKQSFTVEKLGAKVVGIDCSKEAISFANYIKKETRSKCHFITCSYTKTSFRDSAFDIALFPRNIIECSYEEVEKLSLEINRILKKNGKFIVTMEDGILRAIQNKMTDFRNYQFKTGMFDDKISLPDNKKYFYPTYFWTIPFAKQIFSQNFKLEKEIKIDNNFYTLIFQKR